jgi:hypothetical protein
MVMRTILIFSFCVFMMSCGVKTKPKPAFSTKTEIDPLTDVMKSNSDQDSNSDSPAAVKDKK